MVPASDGCVGTLRKTARLLSHLDTLTPDWLPYNAALVSRRSPKCTGGEQREPSVVRLGMPKSSECAEATDSLYGDAEGKLTVG